jgi:hypothetical protein
VASPGVANLKPQRRSEVKKTLVVSSVLLALASPAVAQHSHGHGAADKAKTVTLTGEVLDMTCFMVHPENATGPDHAKCAKSCLAKGLAPGFLAADGTVYLIIGSNHESPNAKVADFAGKRSTITGVVYEQKGIKAIELVSIGGASSTAGASGTKTAVYTCSMHPEVRQSEPGKCPKCEMNLEKERL